MTTKCTCPQCGFSHIFGQPDKAAISAIETIRLFRATFLQYTVIEKVLVKALDEAGTEHYGQLALKHLHIAVLRKYILQPREYVYLPKVLEACLSVLPTEYKTLGLSDQVERNLSRLTTNELKPIIEFISNGVKDERSLNTVVLDYLYGLLLHADPRRAEASVDGGPLNGLLSSSDWLYFASNCVHEMNALVERAIYCHDGRSGELPPAQGYSFTHITL